MRSMIAKTMALLLGFTLCLSGMALASSAELIAAAKKEGKLRLITFSSFRKAAESFQKKYGITVEGTYVGAPGVLRTVSQESQAGISAIDMFGASPGPLSGLNDLTQSYKPAGYEKVAHHMEALPKDWNLVPIFIHVVGASYNKDLIPPDQAPRSIQELIKPKYKGKIISRTPWLGSNYLVHIASLQAWFGGNEEKWANFWKAFKVNVGRYEPKWGPLHQAVGLKEFPLGIFTLPYTPFTFGRSYPGLGYSTFREPAIWWPNMLAIHGKAPHPNAAKLFMEFCISAEGQKHFVAEGLIPADSTMKPRGSLIEELKGVKFFAKAPEIIAHEVSNNKDAWTKRIQGLYQ